MKDGTSPSFIHPIKGGASSTIRLWKTKTVLLSFLFGIIVGLTAISVSSWALVYKACASKSLRTECPTSAHVREIHNLQVPTARQNRFWGWLLQKKHRQMADATTNATRQSPAQDSIRCVCQLGQEIFSQYGLGFLVPVPARSECSNSPRENDAHHAEPNQHLDLHNMYPTAFTSVHMEISSAQKDLISNLNERIHDRISDWDSRTAQVAWGGPGGPNWYTPARTSTFSGSSSDAVELEKLAGGSLFYGYLRIMQWPTDMLTTFPFKLCAQGCAAEFALNHTLVYRETYKPWLFTEAVMKENRNGCVYHHGFSPIKKGDHTEDGTYGAHALLWLRPGRRDKANELAYIRVHLNALDRVIAASTEASDGKVGKFNVIVDGTGMSMPPMSGIRAVVKMLQDHLPNRLGIIILTNLGRMGEFVLNIFIPMLSKEVQQKLIVLPRDPSKRMAILKTVVSPEYIPTWLGGNDTYAFALSDYYSNTDFLVSEQVANQYVKTMPYYA